MFPDDLRPHPPKDGPPVPRVFPKWPWIKNPVSPINNPAVYDVALDTEIEEMTRRKREEFRAKGYPPGLIEKALRWAEEWAWGLPGVRAAYDISPEVGRQVYRRIYQQALNLSNKWIESLSQS